MANENKNNDTAEMTAEERKVYDRQIRLWGYDGQNRLRATKILLIGMQGLGAEIAKNLILSGIKSITLKDHTDVSILDRCSQFLIPHDSQERNRAKASLNAAQKLNPNVQVIADTTPLEENLDTLVTAFDIVIATECSPATYKKLNESCRKNKIKLFIADVYGLFGFFYQDINFEYNLHNDVFPVNEENSVVSFAKERPTPYLLALALLRFQSDSNRKPYPDTSEEDVDKLKAIMESTSGLESSELAEYHEYYNELFCELSPTTSIIGAIVSQTATNVIMNKPYLHFNVFFYDHIAHEGKFHLF